MRSHDPGDRKSPTIHKMDNINVSNPKIQAQEQRVAEFLWLLAATVAAELLDRFVVWFNSYQNTSHKRALVDLSSRTRQSHFD